MRGNKKDQQNYKTRTCVLYKSQKTIEYSREPKQKQANGAKVTEFTVYQGRVKQQEQNQMTNIKFCSIVGLTQMF